MKIATARDVGLSHSLNLMLFVLSPTIICIIIYKNYKSLPINQAASVRKEAIRLAFKKRR